MSNIKTLSQPKAEMVLRIRRADGRWEDGPKVNLAANLSFLKGLKLSLLVRTHRFLNKVLQKLEALR